MHMVSPYFTIWQIAEQWAEELRKPIMVVIHNMKIRASYRYQAPYQCPDPALIIYPTDFFASTGELDENSVFEATKMVERENPPSEEELKCGGSKYRAKYRTPEFIDALNFLNSAHCPPEPNEEIKIQLSLLAIRREDFKKWCIKMSYPLPKFWFPSEDEERNSDIITNTLVQEQLPVSGSTGQIQPGSLEDFLKMHNDKPKEVKAVLLNEAFPTIKDYVLMRALDPDRYAAWEASPAKTGRPKQWFYELKEKGKKILEAKNMTSSE